MSKLRKRLETSALGYWFYLAASRFANWVVSRKYTDLPVKAHSLEQAHQRLKALIWAEDKVKIFGQWVKHGWVRSVEYVETMLRKGLLPQTDCDEFAVFAAYILKGVIDVFNPRVLTIHWEEDGKVKGHNTCVFEYFGADGKVWYGSLCNWGLRRGYISVREVAEWFCDVNRTKLLSYGEATYDLKMLSHVKVE